MGQVFVMGIKSRGRVRHAHRFLVTDMVRTAHPTAVNQVVEHIAMLKNLVELADKTTQGPAHPAPLQPHQVSLQMALPPAAPTWHTTLPQSGAHNLLW